MADHTNQTPVGGFDFSVSETSHDATEEKKVDSQQPAQRVAPPPRAVSPQIPNDSAPFIVLCGPPSSGKSMVLKSLASYLYESGLGYSIMANKTLLNTQKYSDDCDYFESIIGDVNASMPNTVDYLLADIIDGQGNTVAHFLEAPGEDYFSLDDSEHEPGREFKGYLDKVAQVKANLPRKVIYIILLDLDSDVSFRKDVNLRRKYEQKMIRLYNKYVRHHPSRVILLYNKVDIPQGGLWGNSAGCSNPEAVLADAMRHYPNLFFTRKYLIFWQAKDYAFLPYCTGQYADGNYTACGEFYPSRLWKEITKRLW